MPEPLPNDRHDASASGPPASPDPLRTPLMATPVDLRSGSLLVLAMLGGVFMLHWARELVVDRHVLIYAPPLHDRIGPRLGPVRIFNDQRPLWDAVAATLGHPPRQVRLFPRGGLSYAPAL